MDELVNVYKRDWTAKDIHFWTNPKDGCDNASIMFNGKRARLRAGVIIIKDDQILLGKEKDEPDVFSLPGGSINSDETPIDAAIREAQEEVGITATDVEEAGIDYCECHDEVKDWVKKNVPEEEWWYNYYTCLCIGEYKDDYKGKTDKADADKSMKKSAEFYPIKDVINDPSFKYAWKVALYTFGYIDEEPKKDMEHIQEDLKLKFLPKVLYHATYEPYLKEMKACGFIKINSGNKNWNYDPTWDNTDAIYLAGDYNVAQSFAETSETVPSELLDDIVVLEIPVENLDLNYLDIDHNATWFFPPAYSEEEVYKYQTYEYHKDIPISAISDEIRESLTESLLTEKSRASLISQSRSGDKYSSGKGNRWTQKSKCSVANTVKDYNKIDMDTFWKQDKLNFGVRVKGETGEYMVTITFDKILPKIAERIARNKNKLEFKCIYDALLKAINSTDIYVSCNCPDYRYRLKYWASKDGYEAGEKETRAADITNPDNSKGAACKHILAVLNNVEWLNKIASVINNYINYCKDNMQNNYAKYIFPKLYNMTYDKAVQLTLDDYDDNGEIKDELQSDEELINLVNALGRVRGRIKKGSNRNPVTQKDKK